MVVLLSWINNTVLDIKLRLNFQETAVLAIIRYLYSDLHYLRDFPAFQTFCHWNTANEFCRIFAVCSSQISRPVKENDKMRWKFANISRYFASKQVCVSGISVVQTFLDTERVLDIFFLDPKIYTAYAFISGHIINVIDISSRFSELKIASLKTM